MIYITSIEFSYMKITGITNMEGMFSQMENLKKIVCLESFDTSSVNERII